MTSRNFMTSIPFAMWLYASIQVGFDPSAVFVSGALCMLCAIGVYCLPHTEQELDDVDGAVSALAELA